MLLPRMEEYCQRTQGCTLSECGERMLREEQNATTEPVL